MKPDKEDLETRYSDFTAEQIQSIVPLASAYGPDPNDDGVVMMSSSYEVTVCDACNNAHLWLRNDAGQYFATCTFSPEQIDSLCETLQDIKSQVLKRKN